jgi:PAS domain S-box-containing protein
MTLAATGYLMWVADGRDRLRFQSRVQKALDEIDRRLETRIALIRASRGLFAASDEVTREEFRDFVETLDLPQRYPGIRGLGFVKAEAPERFVISFIEPEGRPLWPTKVGFDLGSDPFSLNALKRARDDGVAAATAIRVDIPLTSKGPVYPGFLVFAPVYRRGLPAATVEQRQAAIDGFVYAPLDVDQLLKGVLDAGEEEEIALQVNSVAAPVPDEGEGWTDSRTLTVAGQPWKIVFRTRPTFKAHSAGGPVFFFLFAGLAFSAALFAVSRAQARARAAGERIAAEQAESEEALRQSEERNRLILATALDAVITIDAEGRIRSWNSRAEAIFGWAEAEVVGRPLAEVAIPPAQREAHRKGMERYRETGQGPLLNRRIEVTALRRDGSEFPVELSITPIGTGAGLTFSGFLRDLTERRRSEVSLKESLERFRNAASATNDLIYEWNLESGTLDWFGDIDDNLGYGPGEFPRTIKAWEGIIHPEDATRVAKGIERHIAEGGRFMEEYRIRRKDGSVRFWSDRGVVLRNDQGKSVRRIGATADITDRRRLERERGKLLERLQIQMERMPVACILTGPDYRISYWNPAAVRIFGHSAAEAAGRAIEELILPTPARPAAADHLRSLAKKDMSAHVTWANVAKDGRKVTCEWHTTPLLDAEGSFAGIQAMAIDITERATLEGQLRQAQKMEAIGRLAGGIAHDFNNLLTAVSGYSDLLLETIKREDPIRGHVDEIRKAAQRAADLTRQLLAFSRKQVLEPRLLDLNGVLTEMDKMLRRVIGEDIDLVTYLDASLGHVKADPGQIEQVVMNLVVNARDAMPKGGRLTIETRNVELDESYARTAPDVRPGPYVLVSVSDNGSGIPPEVLPHLFEPFYTTKERGKGTGLGLSTVYGIIKQSGGHVTVYSEPGRGATFKVYFPRVAETADAAARPGTRRRRAPKGTETLLVVEDEAPVRRLLLQVLRQNGYRLLEAPNAAEAIAAAERHAGPIHLMVTDVVMPGMSGRELAQKLAPVRPDMKVLFMSGYTENAIVHHGELDPGTAFIAKPFTPDSLARKVREVLG